MITLVNFSYKVIKCSADSIKVLTEKFEKMQEAKMQFVDLEASNKGKQTIQEDDKGPSTRTRACLKRVAKQLNQVLKDMKKLSMNISQHEAETAENLKNLN